MQALRHPLMTAILAMALLSSMDALVKFASASVGIWEIVWLRYGFGLAMATPFAYRYISGRSSPGVAGSQSRPRRSRDPHGIVLLLRP